MRATEADAVREKTLHTLKGSAAMMGATRVARLAADLQDRCAALDVRALEDAVERLSSELIDARRAIDAQLASLDDKGARDEAGVRDESPRKMHDR